MPERATISGLALLVLLVATLEPAPAAAQAGPSDVGAQTAVVQPGDKIRVYLSQDPGLSGEFEVDESGFVSLPLVGMRGVVGRPTDEVRRQLTEEIGRHLVNQTPQVTVLRRVRVVGAVSAPGLYFADGTMTVADVVALAGGVSSDGDEDDVRIHRGDRIYQTRLERGIAEIPVQSGDIVVVEKQSWLARNAAVVIGAVISAVTIVVTRM